MATLFLDQMCSNVQGSQITSTSSDIQPSACDCDAVLFPECADFVWTAEPAQFNLSLRGAVALTHDAVSALLRLPMLSGLDITGCGRISSMDKMRLVRSPDPSN